jgi:hypothetical protein
MFIIIIFLINIGRLKQTKTANYIRANMLRNFICATASIISLSLCYATEFPQRDRNANYPHHRKHQHVRLIRSASGVTVSYCHGQYPAPVTGIIGGGDGSTCADHPYDKMDSQQELTQMHRAIYNATVQISHSSDYTRPPQVTHAGTRGIL